ncbi:MAG: DUF2085 domain-containing protein [Anaerolineae bacterium]|nr:DUF2085 domain-containing protein [Anaerolineae bacterium]
MAALIALTLWMIGTPPGVMGKAHAVGYAICHQIAERSFLIDSLPMPLCARCTGIYLGVAVGLGLALLRGRLKASRIPPWPVLAVFAAFGLLIAVDGVNSYVHLFPGVEGIYEPNNLLRLFTGMGAGLAMIHVVLPVFNGIVWARPDERRILDGVRDLLAVIAVAAAVAVLVLTEQPALRVILGLVSAASVVMILSLIGTVIFVSVNRQDRFAHRLRDLAIPLLAGLTVATIQIGLINILRFALTGTWEGFKIG